VMLEWKTPMKALKIGTGRKVRNGEHIAILSIGHMGNKALEACEALSKEGISAAHYDMRFVKPIDEMLLHEVFSKFNHVITIEDGCIQGGMGSAVLEFMGDHGYSAQVKRLGIPDEIVEHGSQEELYTACGYNTADMITAAKAMIKIPKAENKLVG
jgi:1-deoxy-D-xylulose-5-phosphate synthase